VCEDLDDPEELLWHRVEVGEGMETGKQTELVNKDEPTLMRAIFRSEDEVSRDVSDVYMDTGRTCRELRYETQSLNVPEMCQHAYSCN